MDTQYLKEFAAFAGNGHIKGAARQLYIAPATLTAHIAALEAEIGTPLTTRRASGVHLTPAGRELLAHIPAIDGQVNAAAEACRGVAERTIALRVATGFSTSRFESVVMEARHVYCVDHLGMEVEITTTPVASQGVEAIREGDADLAMAAVFHREGDAAVMPPLGDEFALSYLHTDKVLFLAPRGNRLFGAGAVRPSDLEGARLLFIDTHGWGLVEEPIVGAMREAGAAVETAHIDTDSYWDYIYYRDPEVLRVVSVPTVKHYDLDESPGFSMFEVEGVPMVCDRFAVYRPSSLTGNALSFIETLASLQGGMP